VFTKNPSALARNTGWMNHQNKLTLARSNQLPERIIGNSESSFYRRTGTFPDVFKDYRSRYSTGGYILCLW
jgi:hypothetical protein